MRINKTLATVTAITILAGTTTAAAWGFAGGAVIDYSRLVDSIRQTAEWAKMAVNQAEMLANQILVNSGLADLGKNFASLKDSVSDVTNSVDSLISTARGLGDLSSSKEYTVDEAIKKYRELTGNIQADAETLFRDGLTINSAAAVQNQKTDADIKQLLFDISPGVLAERQKANALAILKGKKMIEKAKLTYARGANWGWMVVGNRNVRLVRIVPFVI